MWASHGFTQHFLFLVFETVPCFLLCFLNCKHGATIFFVVFFRTLHFMLFASTFLRISFEVLFLNLYLDALFYEKKLNKMKKIFIENHKKGWEILILRDRCVILKMISKKKSYLNAPLDKFIMPVFGILPCNDFIVFIMV